MKKKKKKANQFICEENRIFEQLCKIDLIVMLSMQKAPENISNISHLFKKYFQYYSQSLINNLKLLSQYKYIKILH